MVLFHHVIKILACAVKRRWSTAGVSPARETGSLHPVAIGAVVEATKPLKPSVKRVALGDSASMQAVTKVNAEQAPKIITQELTRRKYGEGRSRWESTSEQSQRSCRGIGDGMQTQGIRRNTGSPSGDRGLGQPVARESQAGPFGVAERLVVPRKPGNAGGGKGPQLKGDAGSDEGRRIGDEPSNPQ
jgi:hypothetical protein